MTGRVMRRARERRKKVMSSPIASLILGKNDKTVNEKIDETARRIPFPLDRASFGKTSEEIRFGKLSGPIWMKKVRTEMTMRGRNLKVGPMLKKTRRPKMTWKIAVRLAETR